MFETLQGNDAMLKNKENEVTTNIKSRTIKRVAAPLQDITKHVLNKNTQGGGVMKSEQSGCYSKVVVNKPNTTNKCIESEDKEQEVASPIPVRSRKNRRKPLSLTQPKPSSGSKPLISSSSDEEENAIVEVKQPKKRVIQQPNKRPQKKVKKQQVISSGSEVSSSSEDEEDKSHFNSVVFDISSDDDGDILCEAPEKKKVTTNLKKKELKKKNEESDEEDAMEEDSDSTTYDFNEEEEDSPSDEVDSEEEFKPKKKPQKRVAARTTTRRAKPAAKPRTQQKKVPKCSKAEEDDVDMLTSEEEEYKPSKASLTIKRKKTPSQPSDLTQSENGWCFDVKNDHYVLKIGEDLSGFCLSADVFEKLYSHQQIGVRWLAERHFSGRLSGGILADEMGLGKTIQISSFIHGLFLTGKASRILVLCPNSVIGNWQKELDKWAGDVIQGVVVFHQVGKASASNRKRQNFVKEFEKFAKKGGAVMLSTYQTVANHVEFLTESFSGDKLLDSVIIDEAHKIKNKDAKCSMALKTLGSVSKFGLTGTPIMNKLSELYAIYSWCFGEDLLGSSSEFSSNFSAPINQSTRRDANYTQKLEGNRAADELRELVKPYLLKREKSSVLTIDKDLYKSSSSTSAKIGQKNDLVVWCKLTPEQEKWYKDYLSSDDVKQVLNQTMSALVGIVILKQVCNHAIMCSGYSEVMKKKKKELEAKAKEEFGANSSDDDFIDNGEEEAQPSMAFEMGDLDEKQQKAMERKLKQIQEEMVKERIRQEPIDNLISSSIKAQLVKQIVEKSNEEGHRVLIFSQYTRMLDVIGRVLKNMKVKYNRIDGSVTKHQERQRLVDEFNENEKIKCFILSSQAGGVGLNLVGASRVIIVDANFNPSIDEQSVDRCYRIGQRQNVIVYRLVSSGTIEEYIYKRQVSKTTVARTATLASNQYRYLSQADLTEMFTLKNTSTSETCRRMNRIHSKDRRDCDGLDEHIEYIKDLPNVIGISDHDVLFCNQADDVDSDDAQTEERNRVSRNEIAKRMREEFHKNSVDVNSASIEDEEESEAHDS